MMAVVADTIISSPFAIIGSIGVVAQLPNVNRFLHKNGIDVELHTAGKYKRTLTILGKNNNLLLKIKTANFASKVTKSRWSF